ncbi:MAG: polysaccharide biosynthesis protein [Bdellovibrionales bacterium]
MKKYFLYISTDLFLTSVSLFCAFALRLGDSFLTSYLDQFFLFLGFYLVLRTSTFSLTGVYGIIWRYVTARDAFRLVQSTILSSFAIVVVSFLLDKSGLPRSVFVIELFLAMSMTVGSRYARRYLYERRDRKQVRAIGRKTLIYGGGTNGLTLAKRFVADPMIRMNIMGFIDDDHHKLGKSIEGFKVLGNADNIDLILKDYSIEEVVIASSKIKGEKLASVTQSCRQNNIKLSMSSVGYNNAAEILRPVDLSDLLGRSQREVSLKAIKEMLQSKRVLVTGAGGSIGSEIARQVLSFNCGRLLLLDHSEYALYEIDGELRSNASSIEKVTPILLDIRDREGLEEVFKAYRPEVVFHAAAYKHVHLVENNPFSSILNNVEGTKNLFNLSDDYKVEKVVLISSDKAVNPVGVMGATKRVCEKLASISVAGSNTHYCSVRFGNVLGSSGSLIPLLKKQIKSGGPVTVTHEEMTRYFMLIPEAVSLVLNAACISKPGDLFVLKMGEPIKIVDIAKNLIVLLGKKIEEVGIEFIGLRPGEKMYEELYITGNEIDTSHPDILVVPNGDEIPRGDELVKYTQELEKNVSDMLLHAKKQNKEALYLLNDLVLSKSLLSQKKDGVDVRLLEIVNKSRVES